MGMAASQARLLSITSRMADNELRAQIVNNSKMRLATESSKVSEEYVSALNSSTMMISNYDDAGNSQLQKLTYNALTSYSPYNNQYGLVDANGKLLVSEKESELYKSADGDLDKYLNSHGLYYECNYFNEQTFGGETVTLQSTNPETGVPYELGKYSIEDLKNRYLGQTEGEGTAKKVIHTGYNEALQSKNYKEYIDLQNAFEAAKTNYDVVVKDKIEQKFLLPDTCAYKQALTDIRKEDTDPWTVYITFLDAVFGKNIYPGNTASPTAPTGNQNVIQYLSDSGWTQTDSKQGHYLNNNQFIKDVLLRNNQHWVEEQIISSTTVKTNGDWFGYGQYVEDENGNRTYEFLVRFVSNHKYAKTREVSEGNWVREESAGTACCWEIKRNTAFAAAAGVTRNYGEKECTGPTIYFCEDDGRDGNSLFVYAGEDIDNVRLGGFSGVFTDTLTNEDGSETYESYHRDYGHGFYDEYYNTQAANNGNEAWQLDSIRDLVEEKLQTFKNGLFNAIKDKFGETCQDTDVKQAHENYITARNKLIDFVYGTGASTGAEKDTYIQNAENMLDPGWIIKNSGTYKTAENFKDIEDIFILDTLFSTYGEPKWGWTDKTDTSGTGGNPDAKVQWYTNLFDRMKKGFKVIEDGLASSNEWIQFAFESGLVSMEQIDKNNNWISLIYTNCSDITENTDELAVTKAEAKYKKAMNDIENKDKRFDVELKNIDTEHNSLQTEYDSVKSVIDKNIERSFKMYS